MTDFRLLCAAGIPPSPYTESQLRDQWNAQADEFNQWESLDSGEQHAWAQARALSRAVSLSPLPPRIGHILRLAEIIREVDGSHSLGAEALAEAILNHPEIGGVFTSGDESDA